MFLISPLLKFIMSTIYEWSTSNPSTQLTTFVEFEFNKTSLVYSGLILVSFRSAWACIRSVHSTYIDVYCFRMVKNTKLFAIAASFRFFVRNRGVFLLKEIWFGREFSLSTLTFHFFIYSFIYFGASCFIRSWVCCSYTHVTRNTICHHSRVKRTRSISWTVRFSTAKV